MTSTCSTSLSTINYIDVSVNAVSCHPGPGIASSPAVMLLTFPAMLGFSHVTVRQRHQANGVERDCIQHEEGAAAVRALR